MGYNKIVVIGNGFDLNLGLKTSYTDFIASDFFDSMVQSENELCKYLKEKQTLKNWIDIENELKIYSREVYKNNDRTAFRREYQLLCGALCDYLNSLDISQIDKTSTAYTFIAKKLENALIINFNYTDSIDHILSECQISHEILRVHGRAMDKQIVFGVEDNARINENDVFLKKSTCLWNNVIDVNQKLSSVSSIIFLGYSLGETDHHYFSDFFRKLTYKDPIKHIPKEIIISYYKEDGLYDVLKRIDVLTHNQISALRLINSFYMLDLAT